MSSEAKPIVDSNGRTVQAGDLVTFAYGLPPVRVEGRCIEREGQLIVVTPGHKPEECRLDKLRKHVGNFYVVPPPKPKKLAAEVEARIFHHRRAAGTQ